MNTGVNQKVLPLLSTETLLHIWLSTEYYGFQPSRTAVDTVSLHALDPTVPRKRMQIGFLLAPIVKEVSKIVSKALFFLILGLQIFFQNIKVGGGKKIKIKLLKKIFLFNLKHIWIGEKKITKIV